MNAQRSNCPSWSNHCRTQSTRQRVAHNYSTTTTRSCVPSQLVLASEERPQRPG
ncbi:MAG: hypothetical protein EBY57_09995 [Actinobacteria bacterium]|nr:hypothetical protein [Actinomycetota bacterium]